MSPRPNQNILKFWGRANSDSGAAVESTCLHQQIFVLMMMTGPNDTSQICSVLPVGPRACSILTDIRKSHAACGFLHLHSELDIHDRMVEPQIQTGAE